MSLSLPQLPTELIVAIFKFSGDLMTAADLGSASKSFNDIWNGHLSSICDEVLPRIVPYLKEAQELVDAQFINTQDEDHGRPNFQVIRRVSYLLCNRRSATDACVFLPDHRYYHIVSKFTKGNQFVRGYYQFMTLENMARSAAPLDRGRIALPRRYLSRLSILDFLQLSQAMMYAFEWPKYRRRIWRAIHSLTQELYLMLRRGGIDSLSTSSIRTVFISEIEWLEPGTCGQLALEASSVTLAQLISYVERTKVHLSPLLRCPYKFY